MDRTIDGIRLIRRPFLAIDRHTRHFITCLSLGRHEQLGTGLEHSAG